MPTEVRQKDMPTRGGDLPTGVRRKDMPIWAEVYPPKCGNFLIYSIENVFIKFSLYSRFTICKIKSFIGLQLSNKNSP
jgi:hypothetical protein